MSKNQGPKISTPPPVSGPAPEKTAPVGIAKPESLPEAFQLDIYVSEVILPHLSSFHGILAEKAMKGNDPTLDVAVDKMAQTITKLTEREKERRKKGLYGQEA